MWSCCGPCRGKNLHDAVVVILRHVQQRDQEHGLSFVFLFIVGGGEWGDNILCVVVFVGVGTVGVARLLRAKIL